MVFDININGVEALRRNGVAAERLPLGGVPSMVGQATERDIDVLFLGGDTPRRGAVLSTLGPLLWNRHSELRLFRFTEPVHGGVPGLVFGRDKYDLLARSQDPRQRPPRRRRDRGTSSGPASSRPSPTASPW